MPLHKFLHEDALGSAWRAIGRTGEPSVGAKSIACPARYSKVMPETPHRVGPATVAFPYAEPHGSMTIHPIAVELDDARFAKSRPQADRPFPPEFDKAVQPLRTFAISAGLIVSGVPIPRNIAVAFLRHKRGGGHQIDWKLGQSDKKWLYSLLASVFDPQSIKLRDMETFGEVRNGQLNVLEQHIWSVAHDLFHSADIQAFLAEAAIFLGPNLNRSL
ncbi:MAG: hypothetical protein M3Y41_11855 [Pseudomonadota bacterium]|nr:hypothetical protein [Pseudomonadota bacterium]